MVLAHVDGELERRLIKVGRSQERSSLNRLTSWLDRLETWRELLGLMLLNDPGRFLSNDMALARLIREQFEVIGVVYGRRGHKASWHMRTVIDIDVDH